MSGWFGLVLLVAVVGQRDTELLAALRAAGCRTAQCMGTGSICPPQRAADNLATDFGSISCSSGAAVTELELSLASLDGNLTFPRGTDLKNVTVTGTRLRAIDMSGVLDSYSIGFVNNALLVTLVAVGWCIRLTSNPLLTSLVIASLALTNVLTISGATRLRAVDLTSLGPQFNTLRLVDSSVVNVTGLTGRKMNELTLVNNAALASLDEFDFSLADVGVGDQIVNVTGNPSLQGVCRLRQTGRIAPGCVFETPCVQNRANCDAPCAQVSSARTVCTAVPTPVACATPTHVCAPNSLALRLPSIADKTATAASDRKFCIAHDAGSQLPRATGNTTYACALTVTADGARLTALSGNCTLRRNALGEIASFDAVVNGAAALTLRDETVRPAFRPCLLSLALGGAASTQATTAVVFQDAPPTTTTTTTATTATAASTSTSSASAGTSGTPRVDTATATATTGENGTTVDSVSSASAPALVSMPTDKGATYGIVGGVVGFVLIVAAAVLIWAARRRRPRADSSSRARRNSNEIMPPPLANVSARPQYDSVTQAAGSEYSQGNLGNMYVPLPIDQQRASAPSAYW